MATYEKYELALGPYQEGNLADIELEMDALFPMTDVNVTMQVRDSSGNVIIAKSSYEEDEIDITGQDITITLDPDDTKGHPGLHDYEIDFLNDEDEPFATIGGKFTVSPEVNTLTTPPV